MWIETERLPWWLYFWVQLVGVVNTLRPRQDGRLFPDDTFKRIFLNENIIISIKISLKFVPKGPINNIPTLVQIMTWRRPGDKPLSEPMKVSLLTHICVTRPQWVNPWQQIYSCENCASQHYEIYIRADSRLAPSQWKTALQSNAISQWLRANLASALYMLTLKGRHIDCHFVTGCMKG